MIPSYIHLLRAKDLMDRRFAEPLEVAELAAAAYASPAHFARGVNFLTEPAKRPYGIEATLRDNSGNWFSMTQRGGSG
jgi:transcriptional regulator GlxA family with amidase domain